MHPIQQRIFDLSQTHDVKNMGLRTIGRLIGVEHPQVVKYHMQKMGLLEENNKKIKPTGENISLPSHKQNLISIPILGLANCGPAEVFADTLHSEGSLTISPKLLSVPESGDLFAVRAVGSSMNRASIGGNNKNIEDGDYVIVDRADRNAHTGDYVLSIIGGLANIKKYIEDRSQRQISLVSESKQFFPPIYLHEEDVDDYLVNGKVVDVVKPTKNDETHYEPI